VVAGLEDPALPASTGCRRNGQPGETGALLDQPPEELALVIAHLGSGAWVTAVLEGRSIDTSMGLTPLEGLMMGTRAGSIDPGILLYAMRVRRVSAQQLDEQLWHQSGVVGVTGRKAGMRTTEEAAEKGNKRAQLAVDIFVHRAGSGDCGSGDVVAANRCPRLHGRHRRTFGLDQVGDRAAARGTWFRRDSARRGGGRHAPDGARLATRPCFESRRAKTAVIARQVAALL